MMMTLKDQMRFIIEVKGWDWHQLVKAPVAAATRPSMIPPHNPAETDQTTIPGSSSLLFSKSDVGSFT